MKVLICKNTPSEGPGTLGTFLLENGDSLCITDLSRGERMPDAENFDALVMMGGPMSVNEADIYPYISAEESLVRTFTATGRRVLGVCLGAQIIAKALGAPVYRGKQKEIGWFDISISKGGMSDPLFSILAANPETGLPEDPFKVFHWHGETFDLPENSVHLASSVLFPNQAFRYGEGTYAFQFHIEVTKEMVMEWLRDEDVDHGLLKQDTDSFFGAYNQRAHKFYEAFFGKH